MRPTDCVKMPMLVEVKDTVCDEMIVLKFEIEWDVKVHVISLVCSAQRQVRVIREVALQSIETEFLYMEKKLFVTP